MAGDNTSMRSITREGFTNHGATAAKGDGMSAQASETGAGDSRRCWKNWGMNQLHHVGLARVTWAWWLARRKLSQQPESPKSQLVMGRGLRGIQVEKEAKIFTKQDLDCFGVLHNNAAVISLSIADCDVKHMFIDWGSVENIIHKRVLKQMEMINIIIPNIKMLADFNMPSEMTWGEVNCTRTPKGYWTLRCVTA